MQHNLNTRSKLSLWQDRALIELNRAVLHSFTMCGVTIIDHHTVSAQFMRHWHREAEAGRIVPADWGRIVPPLSASTTEVFHQEMQNVYRTLFGKLHLQSHRLLNCMGQEQQTRSFNPVANLLKERTSPELLYLESKFASLMSYGLSVKLLQEVLPIEGEINSTSVRKNLHSMGQRLESELGEEKGSYIEGCPRDWSKLPRPDLPLVIGIDGGYVRSYNKKASTKGNFEVIVGKSIKADGTSKRFGGVYCYDLKPQRRIFEVLISQGMQMNQQVTFLSDGDEKLRELQFYLNPNAEYLLDWFHITMNLSH